MRQILLQNTIAILLQNATEVYYKMPQILLQNAIAILLQNATEVYYKMRQFFYYKMLQFYYKMRQLVQIATTLLQNVTVITKCDLYYKLRPYKI